MHAHEKRIIDGLLAHAPAMRDVIVRQIEHARVEAYDPTGSLVFHGVEKEPTIDGPRVPIEAMTRPRDQSDTINILLHVVNGKVHMLEFYRSDGEPIDTRSIDLDDLEVLVRHAKPHATPLGSQPTEPFAPRI